MTINKYLTGVQSLDGGNDYYFSLPPSTPLGQPFSSIPSIPVEEVYIECNASNGGSIHIFLPAITSFSNHWNIKIYITLIASTESNSVTITPYGGSISPFILPDYLNGESNQEISVVNETYFLHITAPNNWMLLSSDGGLINDYRLANLPKSVVSQTSINIQNYGTFYGLGSFPVRFTNIITLSNNDIATIGSCLAVLGDGTLIYDAYDLIEYNNAYFNYGYWVAFKPDIANPTNLVRVADLKMTDQFWDNWYNRTYQNDTYKNRVTFLTEVDILNDYTTFTTYNTQLEITNDILTATDSIVGNGDTILNIYNTETGSGLITGTWAYDTPYYNLQNDYYGMMDGNNVGFVYYTDVNTFPNWVVGLNILTGQIISFQPLVVLNNTTNFNPLGGTALASMIVGSFVAHPSGCLFYVNNGLIVDDGDNYKGVTALFSPNWTNNTRVVYLNDRAYGYPVFNNVGGSLFNREDGGAGYGYDYDSNYFYSYVTFSSGSYQGIVTKIFRAKLDSNIQISEWSVMPDTQINVNKSVLNCYVYSNNSGMLLLRQPLVFFNFSAYNYIYWKNTEAKPYYLQSNNAYPTNLIDNKAYSCSNILYQNNVSLGLEYDTYKVTF